MGAVRQFEGARNVVFHGEVVFGASEEVSHWVADRVLGYRWSPGLPALGVVRNGELIAGVIYDNFNGIHCEAIIAAVPASGWASRRTLHALFFHPFGTMGCEAITCLVPSSNLPSLNLCTGLGFQPEAIIRYAAHDQSSLIVLKMLSQDCRWIAHGQRKFKAASGA